MAAEHTRRRLANKLEQGHRRVGIFAVLVALSAADSAR